jgi:hypothetical protein
MFAIVSPALLLLYIIVSLFAGKSRLDGRFEKEYHYTDKGGKPHGYNTFFTVESVFAASF